MTTPYPPNGQNFGGGIAPYGSASLLPGRWNGITGRATPGVTSVPADGSMRGGRLYVGRTCLLTQIGLNIAGAGAVGSTVKLFVASLNLTTGLCTLLTPDVAGIDGTAVGIGTQNISVPVIMGSSYIIGAVCQGGVAAPTLTAVTGSDSFWDASTAAGVGAVGGLLAGVTGALPATFTLSALGSGTNVPNVAVLAAA